MLKKKTVFVIGAGASVEAGLPTGAELTQQIASLLNLRWDLGRQTHGDFLIGECLTNLARGKGDQLWDIKPQADAARRISGAMTEALSIDNYMEAHSNDADVMLVGKLAIARAIGMAEKGSKLYLDPRSGRAFNPASLKDTWYHSFWQLLHQGVTREEVANIFHNLTIVSFNYDRCVQQRLFFGLKSYYGLGDDQALTVLSKLNIQFPYGSLGSYDPSTFGTEHSRDSLPQVAAGLKTFSERVEDEDCLSTIKGSISSAELIVFLGYAFHPQNNKLLSSDNRSDSKHLYATAYGIQPMNRRALIAAACNIVGHAAPTEIDFSKCCAFFNNYWYHLSDT